jgi:hypothetical protein
MLFTEALDELINGKYVARESWDSLFKYLIFMPGMTHIWQILYHPTPNAGNWMPSVEEMKASDWKVIDKVNLPVQENPPS